MCLPLNLNKLKRLLFVIRFICGALCNQTTVVVGFNGSLLFY